MKKRIGTVERNTRETQISLWLDLDGSGTYTVSTGLPFLDHMLELFAKHALLDMKLKATGDIDVDYHHLVEDIGLALGQALNEALGERKGIRRYGWCMLPMDDALARVALDLGGRPYLVYQIANRRRKILQFDLKLLEEFMRAFVTEARMNLHIAQLYGDEPHHAYEAVFKGLAHALRRALEPDPRIKGVLSSKGMIDSGKKVVSKKTARKKAGTRS